MKRARNSGSDGLRFGRGVYPRPAILLNAEFVIASGSSDRFRASEALMMPVCLTVGARNSRRTVLRDRSVPKLSRIFVCAVSEYVWLYSPAQDGELRCSIRHVHESDPAG